MGGPQEGRIWSAIRSRLERERAMLMQAATADRYEQMSAALDDLARSCADAVIDELSRPTPAPGDAP